MSELTHGMFDVRGEPCASCGCSNGHYPKCAAAAQPPTDVIELQRAHQRQMAELVNRYEAARTDWQNTGCPFCPRCGYPDPLDAPENGSPLAQDRRTK